MILGKPTVTTIDGAELTMAGGIATLTAERDLVGVATGRFSRPPCGLHWPAEQWPSDIEFAGFAFTQFALPVTAGADLDFDFRPAPGLSSPRAMSPVLARSGGEVVLLAPVDSFHEQIIAVADDGLRWGWHGDLDTVPAGFSSSLGIFTGSSVTDVFDAWRRHLVIPLDLGRPTGNPLSTHLSYWTDNGAAYWYRTESNRTISESVAGKVEELHDADVPVCAVELDSWFYSHATPRAITEVGYPDEVPPTGMSEWVPRPDAYRELVGTGHDPVEDFAARLGRPPLVLHARHIAPTSPYVTDVDDWWIDEHAAHPHDPAFFRRWFDDAVRWGATVIEQDWMLMIWFGVRAMRAAPGRAAAWQRALNGHARSTGVDLVWCMATPADLMEAATLDRVIAVRTCDDYRFAPDPAFLWTWFLTVNRLAGSLGLTVFKDCFFSNSHMSDEADAIDGDPHAELEALLAAMSGGPVGIGDRIGRTDREIVMRTCDDDGRLRRLDGPIAAVDDCLFGGPARGDGLMWATTTATTANGVWRYVLAINTATRAQTIVDQFDIGREATVLDWRNGRDEVRNVLAATLSPRDWSLFVVAPSNVGDPFRSVDRSKYVVVESAPGP